MTQPKKNKISGQFVHLPREMLESDAWRSLGINDRRLIDFLSLQHLRHAGTKNGRLHATYRQLSEYGLASCYAPSAIRNTEECGLIRCARGGMRVATLFALTWLPTTQIDEDGVLTETPATNDWRNFRDPTLRPLSVPKRRNLYSKGDAGLPSKDDADRGDLHSKDDADGLQNLHRKGDVPYRRDSNQVVPVTRCRRWAGRLARAAGGGA